MQLAIVTHTVRRVFHVTAMDNACVRIILMVKRVICAKKDSTIFPPVRIAIAIRPV